MRKLIVAALLTAASASAATITPGDIAKAPPPPCWGGGPCVATPPPPVVYLLDRDMQRKLLLPGPLMVAFGPNGHLFGGFFTDIAEYDASLAIVRHFTLPFFPAAITVAQNGDLYALSWSGSVAILSPAAVLKQTFTMPFTSAETSLAPSFDLASDQCTIVYTDNAQNGRRFDACTQTPLADLAPGPWDAVRAMGDGGYLAARQSTLSIFDAQNHLLRSLTLQIHPISAIAFDSDPAFVRVGTTFTLEKIRLSTGERVDATALGPLYLAVNGEQRPAAAAFATTVPSLSPPLLFGLAAALIALAWQRLGA